MTFKDLRTFKIGHLKSQGHLKRTFKDLRTFKIGHVRHLKVLGHLKLDI